MTNTNYCGHRSNESAGAALLELVICIPVLAAFLVFMIEFGKYFGQLSNISHSAYNAVIYGGEFFDYNMSVSDAQDRMQDRFNYIWGRQTHNLSKISSSDVIATITPGADRVQLELTGRVEPSLIGSGLTNYGFPFKLAVTGPIITIPDSVDSIRRFENPPSMLCLDGVTEYARDPAWKAALLETQDC